MEAPPLTRTQRTFVLITGILASAMAYIDSTALNVALPSLQRNLNLTATQLLWIVNIYTLFLASLILLGGSLGDNYGKKKVFLYGIIFFTIFSVICGLAPNGTFLIVARAFQGMGGALMIPGGLALVSSSYPKETRGKAIGTWSMFSAFTTVLGPVLGGWLASMDLWRVIFFLNVPFGLFCIIVLITKIPEPTPPKKLKVDWLGAFLVTLALAALMYGFLRASRLGFQNVEIIAAIVLGVLVLIAFVKWEKKAANPMMPLPLFASSTFSGANMVTLILYGPLSCILFFIPLNMIQIQGYQEYITGLAILPFGIFIAIMSRFSGNITDKYGPRLPLALGSAITGFSFFMYTFIGQSAGAQDFWFTFLPALMVGGLGMGLSVVPITTAVMNSVSESSTGIASGVNNTVSRISTVLVLATFGAIAILAFKADITDELKSKLTATELEVITRESDKLAETKPPAHWPQAKKNIVTLSVKENFIEAFNLVSILCALMSFGGTVVALTMIRKQPPKKATP